jgi:hypothetical protein
MPDPVPNPAATFISDTRIAPDNKTIIEQLGLLGELAGTWRGHGFNLIARPAFHYQEPLYLQLNQTDETLTFTPIGSAIPNRGFGQDDISLYGLTYLQQISDAANDGGLHIEPGIWVTQPPTSYPVENPPAGGQIIARLATIPHGNALLAAGAATEFAGTPLGATADPGTAQGADGANPPYIGSVFPSFNSTPLRVASPPGPPGPIPAMQGTINAAGSSEALSAPKIPATPFTEYNITNAAADDNPRSPLGTTPLDPPLPAQIHGVNMQDVVNDPIRILRAHLQEHLAHDCTVEGVAALNISTQSSVSFHQNANDPLGAANPIPVPNGAGGIENILFLQGINTLATPPAPPADPESGPNALVSLVYATFWIERITPKGRPPFMQLQYAQMTILDFGVLNAPPPPANPPVVVPGLILGWPHISIATLKKTFD